MTQLFTNILEMSSLRLQSISDANDKEILVIALK
jgi:hypothetical protein